MRIVLLTLLVSGAIWATPILIDDAFPGSTWPTPGYDVVGNRGDFDIESLWGSINGNVSNVHLAFNSRYADLRPFSDSGLQIDVGDLLFELDGVVKYGIPLVSHAGSPNGGPSGVLVDAGHLYRVNGASGVLTARQVLNDPSVFLYRPGEQVWLRDDGLGSLTDLAAGTVKVTLYGDGTANALYDVKLHFSTPDDFRDDLSTGKLRLHFASSTSGGDIAGYDTPGANVAAGAMAAPEASTYMLLGASLLALGLLKRVLGLHGQR